MFHIKEVTLNYVSPSRNDIYGVIVDVSIVVESKFVYSAHLKISAHLVFKESNKIKFDQIYKKILKIQS